MKQEEFLAAIKKQQSLIRQLFTSRKRREEVIDQLTRECYEHLRGKFFKAGGEHFKAYEGVTYYIAAVHGYAKATDTDDVIVCLECRFVMSSSVTPGFKVECDERSDNIGFYTETFCFSFDDNLDEILAPLYISQEKAAKSINAMYDEFIKKFLKKG